MTCACCKMAPGYQPPGHSNPHAKPYATVRSNDRYNFMYRVTFHQRKGTVLLRSIRCLPGVHYIYFSIDFHLYLKIQHGECVSLSGNFPLLKFHDDLNTRIRRCRCEKSSRILAENKLKEKRFDFLPGPVISGETARKPKYKEGKTTAVQARPAMKPSLPQKRNSRVNFWSRD